jgi:hypothetical protein
VFRTALAVAAALVATAFGMSTYERWLLRRSRQYLAWSVAMALFVVGALALAWGSQLGWSSMSFRLFYAAGAITNVPFLAAGQMYLLVRKRTADLIFGAVTVVCSLAFGVVLSDPFTGPLPADRLPKGDEVFRLAPRIFAGVGSGGAALVLAIGTIVGIVRIAKARQTATIPGSGRRIAGLALITLGTFVSGASGLLNSVLGAMSAFSVTLTVGVIILFAGFLLSTASSGTPRASRTPAPKVSAKS